MSWVKITDCKKRLLAPDGLSFIYPSELWVNGKQGEYLFLHEGKYYITTPQTKYKLKFNTNSQAMYDKYFGTNGGQIYQQCILDGSESEITYFSFKNELAMKFDVDFYLDSYPSEYIVFKHDNSYRMRLEDFCDGSPLTYLHAKYYWTTEAYDPTFNPTTFNYKNSETDSDKYWTNCNNKAGYRTIGGDDYFLKNSSITGDWSVDYASDTVAPPFDWDTIGEGLHSSQYSVVYNGLAQTEHEINTEIKVYNLYSSGSLLGEYSATNENNETITRTVGWLNEENERVSRIDKVALFTANAFKGEL
jgi:hypothetical protein